MDRLIMVGDFNTSLSETDKHLIYEKEINKLKHVYVWWASQVVLGGKEPVWPLGWEDPLEEG